MSFTFEDRIFLAKHQDRGGAVFNVRAFGAAGDGVTDDAAAIQGVIDGVGGRGGIVYFPPGGYLIGSTLLLDPNITLLGVGERHPSDASGRSELVLAGGVNGDMVANRVVGGWPATFSHGISIIGLVFSGNRASQSAGNGINLEEVRDFRVAFCTFNQIKESAVRLRLAQEGEVVRVRAQNLDASGIEMDASADNVVTRCNLTAALDGIHLLNSSGNNIVSSNILFLCRRGVHVSASQNVVTGNRVNHCEREGILLNNAHRNAVTGNVLVDNSTLETGPRASILLNNGASDNLVVGNRLGNVSESHIVNGVRLDGADTAGNLVAANRIASTGDKVSDTSGEANTAALNGGPLETYAPTNVTETRSYNANNTSTAELADVLGTLIGDLQAQGILGS